MTDISVVIGTFNRAHLIERSLQCYANQNFHGSVEYIYLDDDSTDHTQELLYSWAKDLDIKTIKLRKPNHIKWRDSASIINMGIRASKGHLIIPTHPEIMPGKDSLLALWENRQERNYLACKVYYLTMQDQELLDTIGWKDTPLAVREIPGFYDEFSAELRGHPDYTHAATDRHQTWDSWVFGGFTRETWGWFGGFTEFDSWGSVDVDFLNRRRILGIPTLTPLSETAIVIHQNHDDPRVNTLTPRNMERAMSGLPHYHRPEEALRRNLW